MKLRCNSSCRYIDGNVHPDLRQIVSSSMAARFPSKRFGVTWRATCRFCLSLGKRKVYVIEATYLNEHGQNALLKSLEEPPAFARFILTVERPILYRRRFFPSSAYAPVPCSDDDLLRILSVNRSTATKGIFASSRLMPAVHRAARCNWRQAPGFRHCVPRCVVCILKSEGTYFGAADDMHSSNKKNTLRLLFFRVCLDEWTFVCRSSRRTSCQQRSSV